MAPASLLAPCAGRATGAHWGATSPSAHWRGATLAAQGVQPWGTACCHPAVKNALLCLHPAQACPHCFVASGHPFQGRNHVCCSVAAACPGHPRFLQAPWRPSMHVRKAMSAWLCLSDPYDCILRPECMVSMNSWCNYPLNVRSAL